MLPCSAVGYMVLQEQFSYACGLFVLAGLTDMLDGYIARNWPGEYSRWSLQDQNWLQG